MTDEFVKIIGSGLRGSRVTLSDQQRRAVFKYYEMLIEKRIK